MIDFLKEILIEPFKEGSYFIGCLIWIVVLVFVVMFFSLLISVHDEYQLTKIQSQEISARLVSMNYSDSQTSVNPVLINTSNGVGMGVVSNHKPKEFITIWNINGWGNIECDRNDVFRYAQKESVLFVKIMNNKIRIVGIKH